MIFLDSKKIKKDLITFIRKWIWQQPIRQLHYWRLYSYITGGKTFRVLIRLFRDQTKSCKIRCEIFRCMKSVSCWFVIKKGKESRLLSQAWQLFPLTTIFSCLSALKSVEVNQMCFDNSRRSNFPSTGFLYETLCPQVRLLFNFGCAFIKQLYC